MNLRHPFVQALVLVVAGTLLAVVTNALAKPTRKLVLPAGYYPNALKVPPRDPVRVPPPPRLEPPTLTTTSAAPLTSSAAPEIPAAATASVVPAASTTATATSSSTPATQTPAPVPAPAAAPSTSANPLAKFVPHPDQASVEISGDDAALLYANGALFLDARRSAAYEESHIAGARPFSVWEADVDEKVKALWGERQDTQELPIVIYCTGGACEDSHMLAQKLWGIQFNNLYVYKDGFPDWQKRGGRVRTGAQP